MGCRAALVSFRANGTVGLGNYAWILNGDDDTIYIIENVLAMVNRFDHDLPFHLSDNIWFPEWDGEGLLPLQREQEMWGADHGGCGKCW